MKEEVNEGDKERGREEGNEGLADVLQVPGVGLQR